MYELGGFSERELNKLKQLSEEIYNKESPFRFFFDRDITSRREGTNFFQYKNFLTQNKNVTLIDLPGKQKLIRTFTKGVSLADAAILVVAANEDQPILEDEGEVRQQLLILKNLGISQMVVLINKMDQVGYSQTVFEEVKIKVRNLLKKIGWFRDFKVEIPFIPISASEKINLISQSEKMSWWKPQDLVTKSSNKVILKDVFSSIENFIEIPDKSIDPNHQFYFTVLNFHRIGGVGYVFVGRVEEASAKPGDEIKLLPLDESNNFVCPKHFLLNNITTYLTVQSKLISLVYKKKICLHLYLPKKKKKKRNQCQRINEKNQME